MQTNSWLPPLQALTKLNHISALNHQENLGPRAAVQSQFHPYQFYNHVLDRAEGGPL